MDPDHHLSSAAYSGQQIDATVIENVIKFRCIVNSVADPWHFGVDPDPDPRIHAFD